MVCHVCIWGTGYSSLMNFVRKRKKNWEKKEKNFFLKKNVEKNFILTWWNCPNDTKTCPRTPHGMLNNFVQRYRSARVTVWREIVIELRKKSFFRHFFIKKTLFGQLGKLFRQNASRVFVFYGRKKAACKKLAGSYGPVPKSIVFSYAAAQIAWPTAGRGGTGALPMPPRLGRRFPQRT